MVVWAALAASFAASAHALTPNVSWTMHVSAMSPMLRRDPEDAWVDRYTNVDDSLYQPGVMGSGIPWHTAGAGARLSIEYPGSNVTWYGVIVNGSLTTPVTTEVDGVEQPPTMFGPQEGVYRGIRGNSTAEIPLGVHTASIGLAPNAPPETRLYVEAVYWRCPVVSLHHGSDQRCARWDFSNLIAPGSTTNSIRTTGPWRIGRSIGGVGGQQSIPYKSIYANQTASVVFQAPESVMYTEINGTVGPSFGRYTIDFDPPPPMPLRSNTYNAQRRYLAANQTMYQGALDPEVKYTVTITGDQDPTKFLGLAAVRFCYLHEPEWLKKARNETGGATTDDGTDLSGSGGNTGGNNTDEGGGNNPQGTFEDSSAGNSTGSKSSVGAIAGGVVGGVVGIGLLAALLFFLCRRRKNRRDENPEPFVVDATEDAVTPYKMDGSPDGSGAIHGPTYSPGLAYAEGYNAHLEQGNFPAAYGQTNAQGPHPVSLDNRHSSSQEYPATMHEKRRQQTFTVDPNEPMNEETARAVLLALQKHRHSTGVNQEMDAGPAGTVPPSYDPLWNQQRSGSSRAGSSGLGSPPPATRETGSTPPPPGRW